ncbi:ATP-binding protein [Streptomyces collinus]|uniref:ATP-binding protein n=1 Tax=Streptomyces collinus TaxID=42684 RepID=UPI0033334886
MRGPGGSVLAAVWGEERQEAADGQVGLCGMAQRAVGVRPAMGGVQLVVSELVTNACIRPAPVSADFEVSEGAVEVTVWDSEPCLPIAQAVDLGRVGQHGLEIVMAVCRSFEMHREPVGQRILAAVALADDPTHAEETPPRCPPLRPGP